MPKFFLHLRDGEDETLDPEGVDCADRGELAELVLFNVRDLMADDLRKGVLDLRCRLDAEDEGGVIVHSLAFGDAVTIIPASPSGNSGGD